MASLTVVVFFCSVFLFFYMREYTGPTVDEDEDAEADSNGDAETDSIRNREATVNDNEETPLLS